jgi:hypothetical protein
MSANSVLLLKAIPGSELMVLEWKVSESTE